MAIPAHSHPLPQLTPNVIVANPVVRKGANVVLGITALVLPILGIVDAGSEVVYFGHWLPIVAQVDLFLLGAFNLGVINPNIPTASKDAEIIRDAGGFDPPRPHV